MSDDIVILTGSIGAEKDLLGRPLLKISGISVIDGKPEIIDINVMVRDVKKSVETLKKYIPMI